MDKTPEETHFPKPWLDLLRDAPFLLVWHELQTRWRGVLQGQCPQVPDDAPILLLAHPGVEVLAGSGEAIAWLENWRAEHELPGQQVADPRTSRRGTPTKASDKLTVAPRTYAKKKHGTSKLAAISISVIVTPRAGAAIANGARAMIAQPSMAQHAPVIIISDDENEFVQGSSVTHVTPKKRRLNDPELDAQGYAIIDLT